MCMCVNIELYMYMRDMIYHIIVGNYGDGLFLRTIVQCVHMHRYVSHSAVI